MPELQQPQAGLDLVPRITDNGIEINCPGCDKCEATGGYVLRCGSWRHTRAHETVLMCVKAMGYYADQERVREAGSLNRPWADSSNIGEKAKFVRNDGNPEGLGKPAGSNGRNPRSVLTADPLDELFTAFLSWYYSQQDDNPRSVLTPSPESYPGSHYAVFPRTLISPLLQATAPTRVCPVCGAPWCAVVERGEPVDRPDNPNPALPYTADSGHTNATGATTLHKMVSSNVLGHRPTCDHDADPIPGWCLDPFVGSGTTLQVCAELGVNAVGMDLSPEYLDDHAKPRIGLTPSRALEGLPLFAEMEMTLEAGP